MIQHDISLNIGCIVWTPHPPIFRGEGEYILITSPGRGESEKLKGVEVWFPI